MNTIIKLILNLVAMFIGAIAVSRISEFFGVNPSDFLIFYAFFIVCWIFYIFLPQKYSFFSVKLTDAEADYGGGEEGVSIGLLDKVFSMLDGLQGKIPKMSDDDVFTSDERGIIDMVLPQGAGLPRYADTQGPLEFLANLLDPASDVTLQESQARKLLGTRIGDNLTGYLKKLAEIQGKSFDTVSAAAKRVGLTRTAENISSIGNFTKETNTSVGNYLSNERSKFGKNWDAAKESGRVNSELKKIDRMERQSRREEALLERIEAKEKKMEGGEGEGMDFSYL